MDFDPGDHSAPDARPHGAKSGIPDRLSRFRQPVREQRLNTRPGEEDLEAGDIGSRGSRPRAAAMWERTPRRSGDHVISHPESLEPRHPAQVPKKGSDMYRSPLSESR